MGRRATGTNPRALGTNPRALGTNPRAVGDVQPESREQQEAREAREWLRRQRLPADSGGGTRGREGRIWLAKSVKPLAPIRGWKRPTSNLADPFRRV